VTRDEALAGLSSDSPHHRLQSARLLIREALLADLSALQRARQSETVAYVQRSLDLALARLLDMAAHGLTDSTSELEIPEDVKRQIRSQAVEWVTGIILHEIASPIGLVRRAASREIPEFEGSKTKAYLDNLERMFEAIEQLKGAAATPKPEEFDLAALVRDIAHAETAHTAIEMSFQSPSPMLIKSDPALVRFSIANGLRNAIEAVTLSRSDEPHPIVITWGQTDVDVWAAVLDRGPGLVGPVAAAFEIGKSTKKGHSGFGLAIARQAMETLGGTVTLQPAKGGGTLYELRWER
jgi:signal transduction histidine kinase